MMRTCVVKAKPFAFDYDVQKTALLIIDMQRDFCEHGGFGEKLGNDISLTKAIIPTVQSILLACRAKGMTIIHTREGHQHDLSDLPPAKLRRSPAIGTLGPMGRILVRGEYGHDFVDELTPNKGEYVIDKPGKGAFYKTRLDAYLKRKKIESLIVCGVTTHVCVHSTLREANDRGYECLMIEDGTAAFDALDQEAAIRMIHQQGGIFGWTTTAKSFIKSLK